MTVVKEVNRLSHMSEEQLFEAYNQSKDKLIRELIINKYLYIAEILTKKFINRGLEFDDIYQVACIGLIQAVERFDAEKGVKFSSFATPTIIGEIKRYFRDKGNIIRIPRRIYEIYQKVNQAKHVLSQELGRIPKVEEIAEYLNVSEETILEVIESANASAVQSLEQSVYSDDETALEQLVGAEDATFAKIENRDFIEKSLNEFNEAEKEFIKQRYYNKRTQKQIAELLGVSQMYISRLERKIIDKFKRLYYKSVN
ncbi:SigB/SigF/SigG family RNA polymerase sigma factor [Petroclostridium sp. X23]|uniref:SigB/SigF/SigG family RNA polymerase sigma factor n=1 Tax=Petroclostridium sp. X23 TaxID=3045146 RepID=UPI0024AD9BBA|nr:SigB/SigF/SigG family RNA polymerase sigma factor [Petroclostridium sp. X23]WHH56863.1 SigB/SigF/SigG family RNA polymerase sigma factor [Petroclostridium sp. X23]